MRRRGGRLLDAILLPVIALLVIITDQVTKRLIIQSLPIGASAPIAPWLTPVVQFTHVTNTGAAFGILPQFGNVFMIVAIVVIVVIVIYYRSMPAGSWLPRTALGLQLGGAVGNLIDRLRVGPVTDFVDLTFWPLDRWGIFNVADASIVMGVVLLVLFMIWEEWRERGTEEAPEAAC